ncbi:MAG: hypothetical protein MUO64_19435 [Anaerolineales bacterium]|nr:hypothetical protein [Anaerolineales bacterium]
MSDKGGTDNALMEFLVLEAQACKDWVKQADGRAFEMFYAKVLASLREIGISTMNPTSFYDLSLKQRLDELDKLETNHRVELEAAFIATWLSKDMREHREAFHKKVRQVSQ